MIPLLWLACTPGADPVGTGPTAPTDPTPTVPFTTSVTTPPVSTFEPGLNLVVDGVVVGSGGSVALGEARQGTAPVLTELSLSNAGDAAVTLPGDADDWLSGDPRIRWEEPPPSIVESGAVGRAVLALDPSTEGVASGTLSLLGSSFLLEGLVTSPPRTLVLGRLGRVLMSDDGGLTYLSDTQEVLGADEWSTNPKVEDVAYGHGAFVAVGGAWPDAVLRRSDDRGATWEDLTVPPGIDVIDTIVFDGDRFVVCSGGALATSDDGRTFVSYATGWRPGLTTMVFGEGRFVGVGGTRRATTVDGETWETDLDGFSAMNDVVYADGLFVAVGNSGRIATSDDGLSWSEQTVGGANRSGVAHDGGRFVTGGWPDDQLVSTDGYAWTPTPGSHQVAPLAFVGEGFLAETWPNVLLWSADGIDWTEVVAANSARAGITAAAIEP